MWHGAAPEAAGPLPPRHRTVDEAQLRYRLAARPVNSAGENSPMRKSAGAHQWRTAKEQRCAGRLHPGGLADAGHGPVVCRSCFDRRRFLDRLTLAFDPQHNSRSLAFERLMRERNRALERTAFRPHMVIRYRGTACRSRRCRRGWPRGCALRPLAVHRSA